MRENRSIISPLTQLKYTPVHTGRLINKGHCLSGGKVPMKWSTLLYPANQTFTLDKTYHLIDKYSCASKKLLSSFDI
jgi:hypothetical protein